MNKEAVAGLRRDPFGRKRLTASEAEITHLFCCVPDRAFCGTLLDEWIDESPAETECVVCVGLAFCPDCGEDWS